MKFRQQNGYSDDEAGERERERNCLDGEATRNEIFVSSASRHGCDMAIHIVRVSDSRAALWERQHHAKRPANPSRTGDLTGMMEVL